MMESGTLATRRDPQIRRAPAGTGLYNVLDLILDKGIVIDAFVRVSLVGIELLTVDARVVVASVDTYLRYAEGVERLKLYDRSESVRLPELVGNMKKGKAISEGFQGVKKAGEKVGRVLTGDGRHGRDEGDEDRQDGRDDGGEEEGGLAHTLTRGVRNTVGRLVDTITGGDDDDKPAPRHGRREGDRKNGKVKARK